jgi:hypothetical protein
LFVYLFSGDGCKGVVNVVRVAVVVKAGVIHF